jgi:exodeoxyribonuclease VII large subunit
MQPLDLESSLDIYTVSRLNNEVRFLLEDTFPYVWVEGEISNFAAPNSGHWYFALKDASAQVRCAMFKGNQRKLSFVPKDGSHVLIKARVSLYENRGEFQLIAEAMEERGEGKLRRAYELLKKKLEAAGLFDATHKKPLPLFPKCIGVVTSPTGAAIKDILTVLKRRFACVPIIIYPTLVQGTTAAPTIAKAIQVANQRNECDILIIGRGGGSLEDLWPFNEEVVAQAIYQSQIPTISAVGHEVDFTIADFVADKRAPTPSAAAEMITPNCAELTQNLTRNEQIILRLLRAKLLNTKQQLAWMQKQLYQQHPKRRLLEKIQHLDFCELTLVQLQIRLANKLKNKLNDLEAHLQKQIPTHQINKLKHQLHFSQEKLNALMMSELQQFQLKLANAAAKMDTLSPLATLQRGYAIATNQNHRVLKDASDVKSGDKINIRLAKGSLDCIAI